VESVLLEDLETRRSARVAIHKSPRSLRLYEGHRKGRFCSGDRSRAFHSRLLPPTGIHWRARARQPQPLGAAIQSLDVARLDCIFVHRFGATVFQEILRKEEHGEPRALLDCCGDCDSCGSASSTDRHPHRRIEGIVSYGKDQMVMGTCWPGRAGLCLVFFVVCDHTEGSTAAYAPSERQLVRQAIQPRRVKRANGPSSVPDVTGLSAGGLRSRRSAKARIRQNNSSGRLGADFTFRLE
jgi:hypothetical protein